MPGAGVVTTAAPTSADSSVEVREENYLPADGAYSFFTRVLVVFLVGLTKQILPTIASVPMMAVMMVYLLIAKRVKLALSFLASYGFFWAFYLIMVVLIDRLPIGGALAFLISPVSLWKMLENFPSGVALWILFTTPPGMVASGLSKIRAPKLIILGVLVALRFPPTFVSMLRRLRDSMRKRGLSTWSAIRRSGIGTVEYLIVPVLFGFIDAADRLSTSAITRAAEAPGTRSAYYRTRMMLKDWIVLVLVVGTIVALFVTYHLGLWGAKA